MSKLEMNKKLLSEKNVSMSQAKMITDLKKMGFLGEPESKLAYGPDLDKAVDAKKEDMKSSCFQSNIPRGRAFL